MVVLYFSVNKKDVNQSSREYSKHIKDNVLGSSDVNKCVGFDLSVMKDITLNSLDSMLKISDNIFKAQTDLENFLKNLEKKCLDLKHDFKFNVQIKNNPRFLEEGIAEFTWDDKKYPKRLKTLDDLLNKINDKYNRTYEVFKKESDEFTKTEDSLKSKQKLDLEACTYMKRDYRQMLVDKTSQMVKTQYLTTLLVFVQKSQVDSFKKHYQTILGDTVVPMSALQLCDGKDDKMTMWRVVIMDHKKQDYIDEARKTLKVICKEYSQKEMDELPKNEKDKKDLETKISEEKVKLVGKYGGYYSEIYHALLHLIFLRLYTESCLKYGGGDYFSFLVMADAKKEAKIIQTMIKHYDEIPDQNWYGTRDDIKDSEDFFPFIMLKLGAPTFI